jgi:hypothetical protein
MKIAAVGLGFVMGLALNCSTISAQAISTAQISGVVQDASGLAVPGTEIRATQSETGLVRNGTSGPDGSYSLTKGLSEN